MESSDEIKSPYSSKNLSMALLKSVSCAELKLVMERAGIPRHRYTTKLMQWESLSLAETLGKLLLLIKDTHETGQTSQQRTI